ncbi:DUF6096 family protein [Enterococcus sp. DIV1420a]|uniref:DUF6096 family protein n=1 Tax=Enterococcus sp. DIV1420a TaxID=2774672 RepID=UPI0036D72909
MNKVIKMPNTKQVTLGNLTLQLRLGTKEIYTIENRLDESLMGLFMNGKGGLGMPSLKKVLIVLQGANQTSGVKDQDIFDAVDKFLAEGNTTMDIITILQELLDESGFFGKNKDEKEDKSNKETTVNFDEPTTDFEM